MNRDLTGTRFGRLVVLRRHGTDKFKKSTWVVRCDCGTEKVSSSKDLKIIRSCGCLKRETTAAMGRAWAARNARVGAAKGAESRRTHGRTKSPEYRAWCAMWARCRNESHPKFKDYGARGISVCKRWCLFGVFLEDVGQRPSADHSIDRIDNDGNYEPGNVRWATRAEQLRNRRVSRLVTFDGKTMCLADWAKETGIPRNAIAHRLGHGWPVELALTDPVRPGHRPRGYTQARS